MVDPRRSEHAKAEQLPIQIDLPVRAEPALDELLEAQKFLVSGSTLQLHLDERKVVDLRDRIGARCQAGAEQQQGDERAWVHAGQKR